MKRNKDRVLIYSDKSRVRIWLWHDQEGYRIISESVTWGSIIERSDLSIGTQLEDFNDIIEALLQKKKYKVARRWLLRYLRENFSFCGHNIQELQFPGSPYIDWKKVNELYKE